MRAPRGTFREEHNRIGRLPVWRVRLQVMGKCLVWVPERMMETAKMGETEPWAGENHGS